MAEAIGPQRWAVSALPDTFTSVGYPSNAIGLLSTATGDSAIAQYDASTAGFEAEVGLGATSMGAASEASGEATSLGYVALATGDDSVAIGGPPARAAGNQLDSAVAVGSAATAPASRHGSRLVRRRQRLAGVALGARAYVRRCRQLAALGTSSIADRANTVSVGGGFTGDRQITNVATGTEDTDAVNVAQPEAAAGGGSNFRPMV